MTEDQLRCVFRELGYFPVRSGAGRSVFFSSVAPVRLRVMAFSIKRDNSGDAPLLLDFLVTKGFDRTDVISAFGNCHVGDTR